jgi:hypothetical protein
MSLPDNRIRFPSALIDFTTDVGVTGQEHDNYPAPGQARYDWLRMYLLGLLSCQSSHTEPTQFREGTWWFDLNGPEMKVRVGGNWRPASEVIMAGSLTLAEFYGQFVDLQNRVNELSDLAGRVANLENQRGL